MLTQQDLEQMLRNLEAMARSGNRDMAQQMLSELRDLLDRLQSGRMADQEQSQRFGKMMDEFGDIIGQQQKLLDDTFGEQRRTAARQKGQQASAARRASKARRVRAGGQGSKARVGRRPGRRARRPPARAARAAGPAAARHARSSGCSRPAS